MNHQQVQLSKDHQSSSVTSISHLQKFHLKMKLPSQYLLCLAVFATLLLIAARIQSCTSQHPDRTNDRNKCVNKKSYYSSYGNVNPGLKVMDALRAQTQFIQNNHIGVLDKFLPLLPGGDSRSYVATLKSVMEVIRMKERYQALDAMNSDPQLALAQLLLGKVAEESCLWLNGSPDIHIPDCTNIDLSLLEELYLRMDLYETLENTFTDVQNLMNGASYHDIHTCAWMNHRVLDNCAVQNMNYGHRNTLNMLCDPSLNNIRRCDPQLCTTTSPF